MATPSLIELLEPRIAPATFVNAFVVTYTDVDGDLVKVKSSKPIFPDGSGLTFSPSGEGEELTRWTLGSSAAGAALKVKVIETSASGDGTVNVGFIDASGVDLHSVEIEGALNRIDVGDKKRGVHGIGILHVASLGFTGEYGERSDFQWGAGVVRIDGDLRGDIHSHGDLERLIVGGDLTGKVFAGSSSKKVTIAGDVVGGGDIDSGSIYTNTESLVIGGSIIGGSGRNSGVVEGSFRSAVVGGDIVGGSMSSTGGIHINRGQTFWLGGSLIGGDESDSGFILAGKVTSITIAGDIIGGSGVASGAIDKSFPVNHAGVGKIQIEGDIQGGSGYISGGISADVRKAIQVNGSVLGGSGELSGHIFVDTIVDVADGVKVRIGGDLVGGSSGASGTINALASRSIVNVAVEGDIRESGSTSGETDYSLNAGSIAGSRLGTVQISGSIIAAVLSSAETPVTSYAIMATESIDLLHVVGSIVGTPANSLVISAGAQPANGYSSPPGLGTLTVGGDVSHTHVNAGYWNGPEPAFNPDARIREVFIGGDLNASSLTAGIHPGADLQFGTDDDYAKPGELTARSQIASIIVGGQVAGTSAVGDIFAIAAQRILSVMVGGVPVPLTSSLDSAQLAPTTNDVLLREHA